MNEIYLPPFELLLLRCPDVNGDVCPALVGGGHAFAGAGMWDALGKPWGGFLFYDKNRHLLKRLLAGAGTFKC